MVDLPPDILEGLCRLTAQRPPIELGLRIFNHARRYHEAALRCMMQREDGTFLFGPASVLSAFAGEIYLKALIVLEGAEKPPHGHNLLDLFTKLSDDSQSFLNHRFHERYNSNNLVGEITDFAEAFKHWRYIYETSGENSLDQTALAHFASSLYELCIERRPDFTKADKAHEELISVVQGVPR